MTAELTDAFGVNLDEAAVGRVDLLPVPDGATWGERRARILELFGDHVYGVSPPLDVELAERDVAASSGDGIAVRQSRLVMSRAGREHGVDLLALAPPRVRVVVVALNFDGNHTVSADPAVRLPATWVPDRAGVPTRGTTASDEGRGALAASWPLSLLADAGIALVTVYAGDLAPDDAGLGARSLTATLDLPTSGAPMGTIGAWAWGMRAVARHVHGMFDGVPVVALGHSRLGKAALWAAAQDEVFDAVVSNQSGCGGAALTRRRFGENIAAITTRFPHWFTPAFATYAGREHELPVDQHLLLAALAPRPVHVGSAADDLWADPAGEHAAVLAARPFYREGGGSALGYHLRPGAHALTAEDWGHYAAFLRAHVAPHG
ncbi:putative acetyl xylan esterase [Beutenbergia cavernae DSM 12333]|uniref:Putative acetyl xylan esterase n=1 Tax=Beutenbergia cavernae (strain ATCC BAA-8 / DSM 12333 / CCUG 43141 / JCM 11478 / NBRC 16432 / NCIMB 13614 / HKI 0122) TaxID=471853 RepID=C5BVE3_BEUC1|nr:hypothetical protein [Beutenbergia cavernae]ACQ80530.1 putative acetyl xylan esterase [Beutenbergia cavernae DSM 12333]